MTSARRRPVFRRRHAFTLIELLTVIAIIGILAAIIIPVVGAVRKTAQQAACGSNLRQIALATILYAESNGGRLPGSKDSGGNWDPMTRGIRNPAYNTIDFSNPTSVRLSDQLSTHISAYLSTTRGGALWRCPSNAAGAAASLSNNAAGEITYILNQRSTGSTAGMNPPSPFGGTGVAPAPYPGGIIAAADVSNPGTMADGTPWHSVTTLSRIWMITDADSINYSGQSGYPAAGAANAVPMVHKDGRNYAFFDGHMEYRKAANLPANP